MKLRIGTRRSPLALAQANLLANAIGVDCEIVEFVTSGDKKQGLGEGVQRDKKDWIFELEQGLINGQIDCAIHSAKDVPVQIAQSTSLIPVLKRESPHDVLLSKADLDLKASYLKIGTSSLRRSAQLSLCNPKLEVHALRGNINTRLKRLENEFDGIVLAEAGVQRLGISGYQLQRLDLEAFLPASNQGILACQFLSSRVDVISSLQPLLDPDTKIAFEVERRLVQLLGVDCHSAVGIHCSINSNLVTLNSKIYKNSATDIKFLSCKKSLPIAQYSELAEIVAEELISKGVKDFI